MSTTKKGSKLLRIFSFICRDIKWWNGKEIDNEMKSEVELKVFQWESVLLENLLKTRRFIDDKPPRLLSLGHNDHSIKKISIISFKSYAQTDKQISNISYITRKCIDVKPPSLLKFFWSANDHKFESRNNENFIKNLQLFSINLLIFL